MQLPRFSESGVKSFLAHVVGVAVTAVAGAAAVVAFGVLAPNILQQSQWAE